MNNLSATIIGAAVIAAGAFGMGSASAATDAPTQVTVHTISATQCPTGSYPIVVHPGPVWGCSPSVWNQGHHRRHHHP
jgi:hypothetical protein